jgi:hypothetical protein
MQADIIYTMCLVCFFASFGLLYLFLQYKRYRANAILLFIGVGMPITTALDLKKAGYPLISTSIFLLCIAGTMLAWYYIYKFISEKQVA